MSSFPHDLPPNLAAIEDAAIAWLGERTDGFTAAREKAFAAWRAADPRHAAALASLEQTLGLLDAMPAFRGELNSRFARTSPARPRAATVTVFPARRGTVWAGLAAAAAVALGVFVFQEIRAPARELRYTTAAAGYERVRLTDGSMLELNAASTVRTQFSAAERSVRLDAGEAHFAVSHDAARPFVVRAGGVAVRAVGTAFTVRLAPGGVEVTVVEGKVRVEPAEAAPSAATSLPLVTAGERAVVPASAPATGLRIEKMAAEALRESLAWQRSLVDFAEEPLREIVRQFNARNRVQLVLGDPALGAHRIGGTFALGEPEAFVRLLERDGEIAAERRGENEIVLRRR